MFISSLLVSASLALLAFAAPAPQAEGNVVELEKRCGANGVDMNMVKIVLECLEARGCDYVEMEATFATALVESDFNNLNCGDQDSLGIFQQRPSQGWGTASQITNPTHACNAFLDVLIPLHQQHPGTSPGVLAQQVQRSEFPDRYSQMMSRAQSLLASAQSQFGGGGGGGGAGAVNVESSPKKSSSSKSSSSGKKSSGKCSKHYTVKKGNTCHTIQSKFGTSLSHFLSMNPSVNKKCTNLQIGKSYCVKN